MRKIEPPQGVLALLHRAILQPEALHIGEESGLLSDTGQPGAMSPRQGSGEALPLRSRRVRRLAVDGVQGQEGELRQEIAGHGESEPLPRQVGRRR